jgi:predicted nuclease of predicted toxin-antitoxin system
MIIADENLEHYWIELFRSKNWHVFSIRENHSGISDLEIIELAESRSGVLITEDKDFGELVFAYGFKNISVIFIRYDQPQYHTIEKSLLKAVELYHDTDLPVFVTVTKNKIRVRKL